MAAADLVFESATSADVADSGLRDDLLATWVAVTDAGGAVGFTPPADPAAIAPTLDAALARVAAGTDALGLLRAGPRTVGMGFLVEGGSALRRHWRTVARVMVSPEHQGRGAGRLLLLGLHGIGRDLGLEQLQLTVRGGTGVERFYEGFGYRVVGRHPGAIRVGPGDDRDELMLVYTL